MTITWHLEKRKLSDLTDHPRNPRKLDKNDAKQLKESLEKFGVIDKPVITTTNMIIGGHQRKQILKKLAIKEVECWVPDRELTDKEVDELNIRLNKNIGCFDWDKLANEWEITDLLDWGFSLDEFGMGGDVVDEGAHEELDSETLEPGKDEDAKTKLGDVYELNGHVFICADSSDFYSYEKILHDHRVDVLLTDPPYNLASENILVASNCSKSMDTLKNSSWDKNFDPHRFFMNVFPFLKDDCSAYVFTSHHLAPNIWKWMSEWSDHHNWCVWSKPNPMPSLSKRHWTWNSELVCYATRGKHVFNFPEGGHALSVWSINKNSSANEHPTQKPVELMTHILRHSSNAGSTILDPFLGSGTTLIAAEQLGRQCFGIELSPAYCDIIVNRWIKYMNKNNREFTIKRNGEQIDWEASDGNSEG